MHPASTIEMNNLLGIRFCRTSGLNLDLNVNFGSAVASNAAVAGCQLMLLSLFDLNSDRVSKTQNTHMPCLYDFRCAQLCDL